MKKSNYVKQLRKEIGLSQTQFANRISLSQGALSQIENGYSSLSMDSLKKISDAFNVNCNWLVKGNGEMFLTAENSKSFYEFTLEGQKHNLIPLVKKEAHAGYTKKHFDPGYLKTLDLFKLPGYEKGDYRLFEIEGDSMVPTLFPREIVISEKANINKLENGSLSVLVTKEGIMAKRIYSDGAAKSSYILKSDNSKFPTQTMGADKIKEVWLIKGKVTSEFSSSNDYILKLSSMEKDIEYLKNTMKKLAEKV